MSKSAIPGLRKTSTGEGSSGGDATYQTLIGRYLDDENEHIRLAAMVAIAQLGKAQAVLQLQQFFFSSDPAIRRNVASALRFSTYHESVEALIDAITDKDAGVRDQVLTSLARLTGHSAGGDEKSPQQVQNAWRAWWRQNESKTVFPERLQFLCRMN